MARPESQHPEFQHRQAQHRQAERPQLGRSEFGRTVRRWRDRVSPQAAGLPVGGHRRAPGLRREELALLAGISVDYVSRLEQGRATNPSDQVVEALGRALRVSAAEREHLFRLAGLVPPGRGSVPAYITPGVQRMLDRLSGTPVAVSDAAWTLLLANPLYTGLMGQRRGSERNAVWRTFLGAPSRVRHSPQSQDDLEVSQVCALRAAARRYPADQRLRRLVASCARAVTGSRSCGIPLRWAGPRRGARPSIIRGWAP
nr:helix-turn-helix domain-containing protein [Frankia sp. AvcI1]